MSLHRRGPRRTREGNAAPKTSTLPSPAIDDAPDVRLAGTSVAPTHSGAFVAVRPVDLTSETADVLAQEVDLPAATARACDVVRLTGDDGDGVVYLIDGHVAWVVSRRAGIHLESLRAKLVDDGMISTAEFELVVALCRADSRNFGELLVALGLLERDALRDALRAVLRAHLVSLLAMPNPRVTWSRATTKFTGDLAFALDEILERGEALRWRRLVAAKGGSPLKRHEQTCVALRRSVEVDTVRGALTMTTVDISDVGARVRSPEMLPIASRVTMHLNVAGENLVLAGRVVGFERGSEERLALVVAWTELAPSVRDTFTRLLASLY